MSRGKGWMSEGQFLSYVTRFTIRLGMVLSTRPEVRTVKGTPRFKVQLCTQLDRRTSVRASLFSKALFPYLQSHELP